MKNKFKEENIQYSFEQEIWNNILKNKEVKLLSNEDKEILYHRLFIKYKESLAL